MTKIGEPSLLGKKRGWGATLQSRAPFRREGPGASGGAHPSPADATCTHSTTTRPPATTPAADMRTILERYHSLAVTHHAHTKRRRLASAQRCERSAERVGQLTTLRTMAQHTLTYCTKVLKSEENVRRENERERREAEEELRRAEGERALAENFLRRFGGATKQHGDSNMMDEVENVDNGGQEDALIGGIPSKFLDLSHFPKLQQLAKKRPHDEDGAFSPRKGEPSHPIIDCTEETSPRKRHPVRHPSLDSLDSARHPPMRIPSFGLPVPHEVALTGHVQKQNTKRVYISHASLAHVNGTYVQEGCHRGAPLFVRVGPPRKFMGKWDCSVVLRRERIPSAKVGVEPGGHGTGRDVGEGGEHVWKIGLVPAHRIGHPRIIGYFVADEARGDEDGAPKRVSHVDRMDEDDDDGGAFLEPPAGGWRVYSPAGGGEGGAGRASGLRVSYEE